VVSSTIQTDGGYAEMLGQSGGGWTVGVFGGPAFMGFPTSSTANFLSNTLLTVAPYIYVDGYFSVTASLSGFTGGTVNIGTSRFYVIHNTPILLSGENFGKLAHLGAGAIPDLETTYNFDYLDYNNPLNFSGSQSLVGSNSANAFSVSIDNLNDEGILQVDITRNTAVPTGTPAGQFFGQGIVHVGSI
jgi:hypothetical protein